MFSWGFQVCCTHWECLPPFCTLPASCAQKEPQCQLKPQGGVVLDEEGSGVRPLSGICPLVAPLCGLPIREGSHLTQPRTPHQANTQLTLPLSTISFCRLVDVVTRSRMACQNQTHHSQAALPGTGPILGPSHSPSSSLCRN